jgi:hypothetical protein
VSCVSNLGEFCVALEAAFREVLLGEGDRSRSCDVRVSVAPSESRLVLLSGSEVRSKYRP